MDNQREKAKEEFKAYMFKPTGKDIRENAANKYINQALNLDLDKTSFNTYLNTYLRYRGRDNITAETARRIAVAETIKPLKANQGSAKASSTFSCNRAQLPNHFNVN